MKKVILIENEDEVILCTKEKSAVNVKCNNGKLIISEADDNKEEPNFLIKKLDYLELSRYIKFLDYYSELQTLDTDKETAKLLNKLHERHFNMLIREELFKKALNEEYYIGINFNN